MPSMLDGFCARSLTLLNGLAFEEIALLLQSNQLNELCYLVRSFFLLLQRTPNSLRMLCECIRLYMAAVGISRQRFVHKQCQKHVTIVLTLLVCDCVNSNDVLMRSTGLCLSLHINTPLNCCLFFCLFSEDHARSRSVSYRLLCMCDKDVCALVFTMRQIIALGRHIILHRFLVDGGSDL